MRSLYKGIIGFGLVSIPIQVFKAMDDERVTTHWIHKSCHSRIHYQKYCATCDQVLSQDDLVSGAPLSDGRYVVLPSETPQTPADHTITILNFPEWDEIDPVFYEASYWLKPGPGGQKAYALLTQTIRDTHRIALAEMVLRSRPSLAVVRAFNRSTLMMHRMYYPESLREEGMGLGGDAVALSEKECDMARTLVQHMAEPFIPQDYPNQHRARLLARIEELVPSAQTPKAASPQKEVLDLMDRLKASLEATEHHGTGTA